MTEHEWPPKDGKRFIRSLEFGNIVLEWCGKLTKRFPTMDFTDAASHVFYWFDNKLKKNRRFINGRRFKSRRMFISYVRQCVWNASLQAQRQRKRFNKIEALSSDDRIVDVGKDDWLLFEKLEACINKLAAIEKSVIERVIFEDFTFDELSAILDKPFVEVHEIYISAIDKIADCLGNNT